MATTAYELVSREKTPTLVFGQLVDALIHIEEDRLVRVLELSADSHP